MKLNRTVIPALLTLGLAMAAQSSAPGPEVTPRIAKLHKDAIVIDTHIDTPMRLLDEGFDMGERAPHGHIDIPRMQEGGLDAAFFSIWIDMTKYEGPAATSRALRLIDTVYEQVRRHPDKLTVATSAREIRMAQRRGQIALLLGMEGANPIQDNLGLLRMFHRLGIRYLTLTHSKTSNWADSSTDDPKHAGLSEFGKDVVRELNRLGIIVDISHVSDKAFFDALEVTKAPVLASHSSVRSLVGIPRNLSDEQIKAVGENGGVVQIAMGSWFIEPTYDAFYTSIKKDREAKRKAIDEKYPNDPAAAAAAKYELDETILANAKRGTLQAVADHIEHVIKIAGADHVGFGSDFDGVSALPEGLDDVTFLPALTQELANRGHSDADLVKILGGNTLRVMQAVERIAEKPKRFQPKPQPRRQANPMTRNEQVALRTLRVLNACLGRIVSQSGSQLPNSAEELNAAGGRCAMPQVAAMLRPGGSSANGYKFRFQRLDDRSYIATAVPKKHGETGGRSFYTDSTGIIRATGDDRPATADDSPAR